MLSKFARKTKLGKHILEIEEGGQGYDIKDSKEHEAGYDSFITGLSFLAMWKHLGMSIYCFNQAFAIQFLNDYK